MTGNPTHATSQGTVHRAQSWEAPEVLCSALSLQASDRAVSLCSSGDMGFAFAIAGAGSVTIACSSAAQVALGKLKLAAATALDIDRFRSFLGVGPIGQRVFLYHEIRGQLDPATRTYWDQNEELIRLGVLGSGRQEAILAGFRTRVLPLVHRQQTAEQLFDQPSLADQQAFYERRWNTRRWKALQRFSAVSDRLGWRTAGSASDVRVTGALLKRVDRALRTAPAAADPFVEWLLLGRRRPACRPLSYLSADGHAALVSAADRVQWVRGDADSDAARAAAASCTVLHLADAPDRPDGTPMDEWIHRLIEAAQTGTRAAYCCQTTAPMQASTQLAESLHSEPGHGGHPPNRHLSVVYPHLWVGAVR